MSFYLCLALQADYRKACAMSDEKSQDVKNLLDQLSDTENHSESLNRQLKLVEDVLTQANSNSK